MVGWLREHGRFLYLAVLGVLTFLYEGSSHPYAWYWTLLGAGAWLAFGVVVVRAVLARQRGVRRSR